MDPVASGQANPAAGAGSGIPGAFAPGQVLSARVVQALLGDTYLVAVRGLTLVAQSPEPLTPDTVVRLAVLDGSDATGGGPLRVRLMPPGSEAPLPTRSAAPAAADPADEILAMARRLGLPPGPASELVVAAFHQAGAPLAPPLVRQALRLVQAAADPASIAPAADEASRDAESEPAQKPAAPVTAAPGRSAPQAATTASAQPLSYEADHEVPAPTASRSAPPEAPAPGARPALPARAPVVTEGVPAAVVKSAPTSTPLPPAAQQPLVGSRAPQSQMPQASMPSVAANNQPEVHIASVRPPAPPVPVASGAGISAPVAPVIHGESQRPQSPSVAPSVPSSAMPTASAPSLKSGLSPVVTASPSVTTAEPNERLPIRPLAAGYADASLPLRRAAQVGWAATAAPLRESPEVLRLASTAPPALVANATARLATSPLPLTAATLPMALEAVRVRLPTAAAALPVVAAPASPTNLPARESVDLGAGEPRNAVRASLLLAGVRPSADALPVAVAEALPLDERTLLRHLLRLSLSVGADRAATSVTTTATSTAPAAETAGRAPEAAAPRVSLPELGGERLPAPAVAPQAFAHSAAAEPLIALREAVAQDLLPPKDLADYDRVIALPLAINGQPLPARLAVTTRPTPTGGTACWMRVDCQLSRLGSVSVRLGGTDVGPVVITLVASPAAAPLLAEALPALAEDLRVVGVDAALRVAVEEP